MDQFEKRFEAIDARMARIEAALQSIQVTLAGLVTKEELNQVRESVRNWGIAVIAIVFAAPLGMGALFLQASANQLAAFQSSLSAIQAFAAGRDLPPKSSP